MADVPPPVREREYALDSTPTFVKPDAPPPPVPAGDAILPEVRAIREGWGLGPELWDMRVSIVAALRLENFTQRQIASALKMSLTAVQWCIREARKRELLRNGLTEAIELLDNEAVPLAVDAALRKLRKGDSEAVWKVLEGRGLLRNFTQVKSEGEAPRTNMAFQFVFEGGPAGPAAAGDLRVVQTLPAGATGQVMGTPRADEE